MSRRTQGDRDHRQRLLDRFIKTGLAGFADYEILELVLMLAIPQGDVIEPVRGASARKPIRLGRPKGESRRSFESGEYSSCSSSGTLRGLRGYRALPERRRLLVRFAKSIRTDNGIHIFKGSATATSFSYRRCPSSREPRCFAWQ